MLGPLVGTLLYEAEPSVPYVLAGLLLVLVALWPARAGAAAQQSGA